MEADVVQEGVTNTPRRQFLGSALALGAGATLGATVSSPNASLVFAAPGNGDGNDAVAKEAIRQIQGAVRVMRGGRGGEGARGIASAVRVLAAQQQASGGDAAFAKRIRALVRKEGRDAVLRKDPDVAMLAGELRAYGIREPYVPEPIDLRVRARALDAMQSGGISGLLVTVAADFEKLGAELDRIPAVTPVGLRQTTMVCPDMRAQMMFLEFLATASCLVNVILCAGFAGALAGLKLSLYLAGC